MLEENPVTAPIGEQEAAQVKPGFAGLATSIVRPRWKVDPEQVGGAGLVFVRLGIGLTVTVIEAGVPSQLLAWGVMT